MLNYLTVKASDRAKGWLTKYTKLTVSKAILKISYFLYVYIINLAKVLGMLSVFFYYSFSFLYSHPFCQDINVFAVSTLF